MTPEERVKALETEFERLKERQDALDRTLQGHPDVWIGLQRMVPSGTELVIDKAVSEARQGATAMAGILKTLTALTAGEREVPQDDPLARMQQDQLAQRRANKTA